MEEKKLTGAFHLTDDNFKETILNAKRVVLVDFYAEWCGPCQMAAPIIEKLAKDETISKKVLICKLNVDENRKTASEYEVMSIPTLIVFKFNEKGKIEELKRQVGFPGEDGIKALIDETTI